jgi:hypothetical protein
MKTHDLYAKPDCIAVMGRGFNLSWIIEIEYNQFKLSTLYGHYHSTFNTLRQALDHIGYKG